MGNVSLFNNGYNKSSENLLLEQYKLYVKSSEIISNHRLEANKFFITLNAGLLSVMSIAQLDIVWKYTLLIASISSSAAWYFLLKSYRQLNTGKYAVMHEIEVKLPIKPYTYEWQILGRGEDNNKYLPLSHLEAIMPIAIGIGYAIILVISIGGQIFGF